MLKGEMGLRERKREREREKERARARTKYKYYTECKEAVQINMDSQSTE